MAQTLVEKALEAADEQEHQRQERIEAEQASTRRVIRGMIETALGDHVDIESLVDGPTDQVYLPGNPTLVFTRTAPTGSSKLNVRVKGAPRKKQRTVYNLTDVGKAIQNQVDYLPPDPPEPPTPPRWCPRCRNDLWIQDIDENSEHFRCNYCLLEGTLTIE